MPRTENSWPISDPCAHVSLYSELKHQPGSYKVQASLKYTIPAIPMLLQLLQLPYMHHPKTLIANASIPSQSLTAPSLPLPLASSFLLPFSPPSSSSSLINASSSNSSASLIFRLALSDMAALAAYPLMLPFSLPFVKGGWASVSTSKLSVSLVGDLR